MRVLKNIVFVMLALITLQQAYGQQTPQFSQYMYNTISINPAYAGSKEVLVVNLLNRNQWMGVDGAPVTQTLSAHSGIPGSNLGVGLSIVNDKLGFERTTYIYSDVSYKLNLDHYDEYKLTFGIKAGFRKYSLDEELLNDPGSMNDPFLMNADFNWDPNVGVGVYFRGESFYLGVSAPRLLTYRGSSEYFSLERIAYYVNGGYVMDLNPNLVFKPAFIVKYTNGAPISFDMSAMFLINENFWLGGSYRFNDSFGALVNFKVARGVNVGYAYDYVTSGLNTATWGSHELMLNFEFLWPKPRCKCKDLYN
ncbi:type IX secretion system membrane protein PorP/SprF [Aureitalea sp. L0-47]|uniref:PorP/SprF family type IX secretion system membrane protein n=1 Tax=Aureitalea sp. L0-47 TaxID=2816962 RepID=UPI002236F475|nr:type IX secretion system membrane protein PorP/SprF [Aureitalea sp. L0-47]MCW5520007.1 type IX secretion system membrane protein PorP/SprF [Aureitalea sp. L0-47]